jgi:DNA-binding transcriptional MerR regulator
MTVTALSSRSQSDEGHVASRVLELTGITYRQLDYWTRTGRVTASRHASTGIGDQRLYSTDDVLRIAVLARLLHAGLSLAVAGRHLDALLSSGGEPVRLGPDMTLTVDVDRMRCAINNGRRVAS